MEKKHTDKKNSDEYDDIRDNLLELALQFARASYKAPLKYFEQKKLHKIAVHLAPSTTVNPLPFSAINIGKTHNIIFAQICAGLDFNKH